MYSFKFLVFFFVLTFIATQRVESKPWDSDSLSIRQKIFKSEKTDSWFSQDKGLHLVGSTILSVGMAKSLERFGSYTKSKSANVSFGFTLSVGLGKEFCDKAKPGNTFSYKDLTADLLGCLIGFILVNAD